jgi:hypothetical protein
MTSLISIGDLITHGLKDIQNTWKPTLKYTVWFFLAPILFGAVMLFGAFSLGSARGSVGPAIVTLMVVAYIALIVGLVWATTALMRYLIEHVQGHDLAKWKPKESALVYLPRLLWVAILASLPVAASWIVAYLPLFVAQDSSTAGILMAVLFIAALVFTVWISVIFSQAYLLVLTDEARGVEALKRSYAMVLGRWWKTLWRLFVPNLAFQLIVGMIMGLFYTIIFMIGFALFGGWLASLGVTQDIGMEAARASNVGFGVLGIVFAFLIGVTALLLMVAQVIAQTIYQASVAARLFFSLKHAKAK